VYLDKAQRPRRSPEAVIQAYCSIITRTTNSNVHRVRMRWAEPATEKFENARSKVAAFLNAAESRQNYLDQKAPLKVEPVAATLGRVKFCSQVDAGCWSPPMEHHSNIVALADDCCEKGATGKAIPVIATGTNRYGRLALGSWMSPG